MRSLMQSGAATAMIQADQGIGGRQPRGRGVGVDGAAGRDPVRGGRPGRVPRRAGRPALDGTMAELPMDVDAVRELRTTGTTTRTVNGTSVTITVVGTSPEPSGPQGELDPRLGPYRLSGKHAYYQRGKGKRTLHDGAANAASIGRPAGRKRSASGSGSEGLVPRDCRWRSCCPGSKPGRWSASRAGICCRRWRSRRVRRPGSRSPAGSAAPKRSAVSGDGLEQTFDFTSTTRDTEDVFKEIVQSNEFTPRRTPRWTPRTRQLSPPSASTRAARSATTRVWR